MFASGRVEAAVHAHRDWIAREVLAVAFAVHSLADAPTDAARVELYGDELAIALERVER